MEVTFDTISYKGMYVAHMHVCVPGEGIIKLFRGGYLQAGVHWSDHL